MDVSVRELKARLSEYLRRAGQGEEVVITSRGKEVARLKPPPSRVGRRSSKEAAIELLRSQPWIRPGSGGKPRGLKRPIKLKRGSKTLAETIVEGRG